MFQLRRRRDVADHGPDGGVGPAERVTPNPANFVPTFLTRTVSLSYNR